MMANFRLSSVVQSVEIGVGRVPSVHCTEVKSRQWTSLSRLQVQVSFPRAEFSEFSGGLGTEAKSTRASGDFAGLASFKEQLVSQSRPSSASGSFAGLSALKKEEMVSHKRNSHVPVVEDTKKKGDSAGKNVEGGGGGGSSVSLMVSNLPKQLTREEFESFMEQIPEISECRYLSHQRGICRGYGFCDVRPGADVAAVMEFLSKQTLGGNFLNVSVATWKKQPDKDSLSQRGKDLKATLKLKNETRAEPVAQQAQQQQASDFTSLNGDDARKEYISSPFKRLMESGSLELQQREQSGEVMTASSDKEGRLSGESVLAALERFRSAGRGRLRRVRGTSGRSTQSDSEDDEETSSELQLVEFKLEWTERIQSLEASLEQLRRL